MNQPPPTPAHRTTKVIKRYANRKLYDTERSCYVTLEEISQMIKEGEDVRVVDNKSKDDLTAVTLAQIIVEEEKKVQKMPLKLLRSIIQSGNEAFSGSVGKIKEDVERRVESLWKRDRAEGGKDAERSEAPSPTSADAAAATATAPASDEVDHDEATKQGVVQEFVSSTTEAFETWQKRIDERVKEAFARSPAKAGVDVDALRRRIDELEAKIKELEAARQHGG
jgi:polyhydroxyalkanoate synthesis repressor PhaR